MSRSSRRAFLPLVLPRLPRRPRRQWPERLATYGLWAMAFVLGGLGVIGLGQ